jgi:ubiquinone biosynthesis protein COQ9
MAEFRDTWTFVERRIKDALNLQKSVNEVAYTPSVLKYKMF